MNDDHESSEDDFYNTDDDEAIAIVLGARLNATKPHDAEIATDNDKELSEDDFYNTDDDEAVAIALGAQPSAGKPRDTEMVTDNDNESEPMKNLDDSFDDPDDNATIAAALEMASIASRSSMAGDDDEVVFLGNVMADENRSSPRCDTIDYSAFDNETKDRRKNKVSNPDWVYA